MSDKVVYETRGKPDRAELADFYQRQNSYATDDPKKLQRMLENTFCFVTARCNGQLIGFARAMTDGLNGRLAECKLDPSYQGPACLTRTEGRIEHDSSGIAREMASRAIQALRDYGVERIDVLAHGTEVDFCEELGFRKMRGLIPLELSSIPNERRDAFLMMAGAH